MSDKPVELNSSGKPPPRCKHCRRPRGDHKAVTFACPVGRKHRTFGFNQFSSVLKFEVKA